MPYGIQPVDIVGNYVRGREIGEQKAEQRRRQPYLEQLNQLALQKEQQAVELGKKQLSLQDYAIQQQEQQQKQALFKDVGQAAKWADTPEKWEQALDIYEQQGMNVEQFRGRFDLREPVSALNNPDYNAQLKAQENLQKLVQTLPPEQQAQAGALAGVSPQAVVDIAKEGLKTKGDDQKGRFKETKKGFVLDTATGEIKAPKIGENVKNTADLEVKDIRAINSDINKLVKDTKDISSAAQDLRALKTRGTPAAQLAAVFKFMKALDPQSVVREGEQAQAVATGGITDQFIGYINQLRGEGRLSDDVFEDMTATAEKLANDAVAASSTEISSFLDTFDLDSEQRKKFEALVPKEIKMQEIINQKIPNKADQPKTIGRFQVRVK